LYSQNSLVKENIIDSGGTDTIVAGGVAAWYDSTGNILLVKQFLPYPALAVTLRGEFGSADQVGTAGQAAHYINVSGFDRAVALLAEGATGAAPANARLELVNALAPTKIFFLADFTTPLQLSSDIAQVVTY
jgi:hypothetical protein